MRAAGTAGAPRKLRRVPRGERKNRKFRDWQDRMLKRALPDEPRAQKRPASTTRHGITLTDDYAWLKAPNWQQVMRDPSVLDPAIRAYLDAENAYQADAMRHTEALQQTLFAEMKGRIKEDDSTVPSPDGP